MCIDGAKVWKRFNHQYGNGQNDNQERDDGVHLQREEEFITLQAATNFTLHVLFFQKFTNDVNILIL